MELTPADKQTELKRYRDLILATLDHLVKQAHPDRIAYYQQLKQQAEEDYQQGRLLRLKQRLTDLTEGPSVSGNDRAGTTYKPANSTYYVNQLSESFSPDGKRRLTLTESGEDREHATTQVFIQFERSGSSVYVVKGFDLGIRAYWQDDHTVVIETKAIYEAFPKREQVQSAGDVVTVQYLET